MGNVFDIFKNEKAGEVYRFGIVGAAAIVIHYSIYLVLTIVIPLQVAFIIGYIVSFVFNFIFSNLFTFKTKITAKRGAGFSFCHLINFLLQLSLLQFYLYLGMSKSIAPIFVFSISVPINFLLVRAVLKPGG